MNFIASYKSIQIKQLTDDGIISFQTSGKYCEDNISASLSFYPPISELTQYQIQVSGSLGNLSNAGTSFSGESLIEFYFFFRNNNSTYTWSYEGEDGVVHPTTPLAWGSLSYVAISGIVAKDLPQMYTVRATDGVNTFSVRGGPFTYVYTTLSSGSSAKKNKDYAAAMYYYGKKAKAYFS